MARGHVLHVDERTPRRSVAEHGDSSGRNGGGHEVVQHEIESQALAHAARGREPQARDSEVLVRQLRQPALGQDLRSGVRGEGVHFGLLCARTAAGRTVDAAARGEHERPHARGLRQLRQLHARAIVHVHGHRLVGVSHRIVGNRREVHDRIHARQRFGRRRPDVAQVLDVELRLRQRHRVRQTVGEEAHVETDQRRVRKRRAQVTRHPGTDIAKIASDQNSHGLPDLPGRLSRCPQILEQILVAKAVHGLPEPLVLVGRQLARPWRDSRAARVPRRSNRPRCSRAPAARRRRSRR